MKIVVIGGTGLIGKKLVNKLSQNGHAVLAASLSSGINTITGEGSAKALAAAQVVRRGELTFVRGQGSFGVLRDVRA
jgi:nucleoside-diphosphate-sugar epimerase